MTTPTDAASARHVTAARLRGPRRPWLALAFLLACAAICVAAPLLAPHAVDDVIGGNWEPPSRLAWLGTDNLGRDMLSRLLWSTRTTLTLALLSVLLAALTGGAAGLVAGLRGGWIDSVLARLNDVLMSIPALVFALIALSVVTPGALTLCIVVGLLEGMRLFRVTRALAASVSPLDYVDVARLRGDRLATIIVREVLPNIATPLVAELGLRLVFAVLLIATLSFLGLGLPPPATDWGSLAKDNKDGVLFGVSAALFPGLLIAAFSLSVNRVLEWRTRRGG
ncbi:Peptide/nickel transport system permease protein [Paraburkholderia tropica]|uniref:ABC transporter permease n=1 Tax=Paraburkholderia tropica TaxID=92647 RepID=UPI001CB5D8DC|nr:ABC transporter permease [Paraburkholderia tropica]CAG9202253.1 Peptide/nickel transport system permease protein [Paraburkholderia tropica]